MLDRPMIKGREQRALQLGELDSLGLLELPRGDELVNFEADYARFLRFDPGVDDRSIGVALACANAVGIRVDTYDCLNRVFSWLERIERARKAARRGVDPYCLRGLPALDIPGKERLRMEPVGPKPGLEPRVAPPQQHVDPGRDRLNPPQIRRVCDLEGQRPRGQRFPGRDTLLGSRRRLGRGLSGDELVP